MNDFPLWWDSTITVYNKYLDETTRIVHWYKTVLHDCFWKDVGVQVNVGGTLIDSSEIVCRIPQNEKFVPAGEWLNLPDKNGTFTLKQGDIIVNGECPDVIDEYAKDHRSSDLLAKYHKLDSCMEIKKVSINTMRGMINPHYCARGL